MKQFCWRVAGALWGQASKTSFAAAVLGLFMVLPAAAADTVSVYDVRVQNQNGATKFVIDLSAPVEPEIFTLTDNYRLVLDLPEVAWQVRGGQQALVGTGLIERLRYARNKPGHSRIVLDLKGPASISERQMLSPLKTGSDYRLVLALTPTTPTQFRTTAGWPARHLLNARVQNKGAGSDNSLDRARFDVAVAPAGPETKIIVIDPGHGGKDPGAIGVTGVYEKTVALATAKELKEQLESRPGYKVYMTRDTDIFIPLADRVAYARGKNADLFISIHADSNAKKNIRGASVYTLAETASDEAAARQVKRENAINGVGSETISDDVLKILIELAQRDTMNNSVLLAKNLLPEIKSNGVRLLRRSHRFGPFFVLTAADVPSVLVEMGFLSNREDTKLLTSAKWRKKMAEGLANGVDRHFGRTKRDNSRTAMVNH